jgi:hypothetical protein
MGWTFRNTGATHGALMCPRDSAIVELPHALDDPHAVEAISYQDFFGQPAILGLAMLAAQVEEIIGLKEGAIRYERYDGGFTRLDHHLWLSVTKSLVACCVGILADEGKLRSASAQYRCPRLDRRTAVGATVAGIRLQADLAADRCGARGLFLSRLCPRRDGIRGVQFDPARCRAVRADGAHVAWPTFKTALAGLHSYAQNLA